MNTDRLIKVHYIENNSLTRSKRTPNRSKTKFSIYCDKGFDLVGIRSSRTNPAEMTCIGTQRSPVLVLRGHLYWHSEVTCTRHAIIRRPGDLSICREKSVKLKPVDGALYPLLKELCFRRRFIDSFPPSRTKSIQNAERPDGHRSPGHAERGVHRSRFELSEGHHTD